MTKKLETLVRIEGLTLAKKGPKVWPPPRTTADDQVGILGDP
jgi:hypothetical protein